MDIREEIKKNYKQLSLAANHNLSRSEYRKVNSNPDYSSSKIEGIWGTWKSFIADISSTVNFNRHSIKKTVKNTETDIVITSVMDGSEIDFDVLNTLKNYCKAENCKLYILWSKGFRPNKYFSKDIYSKIQDLLVTELSFAKSDKIFAADWLISPVAKNPLQNLDKLSKCLDTIIVASPKQYLDTLPYDLNNGYRIAVSTGTISKPDYKSNVSGFLDKNNHTCGGLRLSWDSTKKKYTIRQLQYKEDCIIDITMKKYTSTKVTKIFKVPAVIFGDLHAPETDLTAFYKSKELLDIVKPKNVYLHDWMSYQSINHHDFDKVLSNLINVTEYTKNLDTELYNSLHLLNDQLADKYKNITFNVVHSNHDEFLIKWLNTGEFVKGDKENRVIGCKLFSHLAEGVNPIERMTSSNVKFLPIDAYVEELGYIVSKHGDGGISGARGNPNAYVKTYNKSITGHTHSPKIRESGVVVGTLSRLNLPYTRNNIHNWAQANCVIYPNGSFQLLFV